MDNNFADQMNKMGESMLNALTTLQKINDKTVQSLTQQQFDAAESYMSVGARQMKALSQANDPQDAFSTQVELTTELGKLMQDHTKRAVDILQQGKSELDALIEKNITEFSSLNKAE